MTGRTALIAGATGLVGGALLRFLLDDPDHSRVIAVSRRPTGLGHPKLREIRTDFDRLEEALKGVRADEAFCCLGTTRAQAGSAEAFRKVDEGYVLAFARAAKAAGAERFFLVSSSGANAKSPFLYPRVKGETEEAVSRLGFSSVLIARPSFLIGERARPRLGDRIALPVMRGLAPLLVGPLKRYRAIEGRAVARALLRLSGEDGPKTAVLESDALQELGASG